MEILKTKTILSELYFAHFKVEPDRITKLPGSGSDRVYFRLQHDKNSVIGAFNEDVKENAAFFSFSSTFKKIEINVPELITIAENQQYYLLTDLGDKTLFDQISAVEKEPNKTSLLCEIKKTLFQLIRIQLDGGKNIDFSKCYPRAVFDRQSIQWDLNYFKYEFLKLAGIPFDEQALENDFNALSEFLLQAPADFFMYRDFQTRNIMMFESEPWFIDYQGGRKGPLQYDLASIVFSPKTDLNPIQRDVMLDFYLNELQKRQSVDRVAFVRYYYGFVLIRILQALGAYGFRGLYEKKANFRKSIPSAIANMKYLFDNKLLEVDLPEIRSILKFLRRSKCAERYIPATDILTLKVTSFSYKKGVPEDPSDNGGGFVFDCRGLPNPGRINEYKTFSGLDQNVIDYLEAFDEVGNFQNHVRNIVEISMVEYIKRGFNHLCVNFGCTGGQHRSVFHAEKFSEWAQNNFPVKLVLVHREMNDWKRDE